MLLVPIESETVHSLTLRWTSGPFCLESPFGSNEPISYRSAVNRIFWENSAISRPLARAAVLSTHIKIREFRSHSKWTPHGIADPVVFPYLLKNRPEKNARQPHKTVVLVHNLHHLVSPMVDNWGWPSVLRGTNFFILTSSNWLGCPSVSPFVRPPGRKVPFSPDETMVAL